MADSNINTPSTNPFADLDQHQELIEKVESTLEEIIKTSTKATTVMSSLSEHNLSSTAHADIRAAISSINLSTEQVSLQQVAKHNESDTAHPDIRSSILDVTKTLELVSESMDDKIAAHADNTQAHIDIRQKIEELKMLTKEDTSAEITEKLLALDASNDSIVADVSDLQNENAHQSTSIANLIAELDDLSAKIDTTGLSSGVSTALKAQQDVIDRLANVLYSYKQDFNKLQASTASVTSLNAEGFTCVNLPTRLGRSQQAAINFDGVTSTNGTDAIAYSIVSKDTNLSFSATSNLSSATTVVMTMNAAAVPDAKMSFTVRATNTTSSEYVEKTFTVMMVSSITSASLGITGLPERVEPGASYNFRITNTADDGSGRFYYRVESLVSGIGFSGNTITSTSSPVAISISSTAPRNAEFSFSVTANDTQADSVSKTFTIRTNSAVDITGFTHNVPAVLIPGRQYSARFSGIPGTDGTYPTYSIANTSTDLSFSKTVNILAGENITILLAATATRGNAYTFTVSTRDKYNAMSTNAISFTVNQLPIADKLLVALPESSEGGKEITCTISGGTNPEGGALTYKIESEEGSLSFSKTTNIAAGEAIAITLPKVSVNTAKSFKVYAVDSLGEVSSTFTTATITVTPVYITAPPSITAPSSGTTVEPPFTITWTDYATYVDMS